MDIADAVWILNYIFLGGEPPIQYSPADVNLDGKINLTDVIYLVNYIFRGGPEPCAK